MKNSKVVTIYLGLAGLLLSVIGAATLLNPIEVKASSGIELGGNVSLLNDIRALSALILAVGALGLSGVFLRRLRYTSALILPLALLALGIGRVLSLALDGMPFEGMLMATGLEFVLGISGMIIFFAFQDKAQYNLAVNH